jgi:hypothetical protein
MKTPLACKQLGIQHSALMGMLRDARVAAPAKDSSGHYNWTAADLRRVRKALANSRRRKSKGIKGMLSPSKAAYTGHCSF